MTFESAKARAEELRAQLNYHSHKYYVEDSPEIGDYEYDMLQRELVEIEKQFPELITPDSPTQRVGGSAAGMFEPVTHTVPLESLQDAFSFEEVEAFDARVKEIFTDVQYIVEPKIDGLSVALEYENGVFTLNTARLKRYIRTFTDAGLYWIEGGHFGGRVDGQWNAEDFAVMMSQNSIKSIEGNRDIAQIGRQLYAFIQKNGYADRWIQHVTDEPILCNADSYRIFVGLVRKYMPGLPLMDAMSDPEIAGAPDIWCPQIQVFEQKKDLFDAVREQGDRIWSYTCCLPGGAYLNRLLDGELTRPLLLGWGNAFYDIEGFLHWGWNQYMPYKVSATDRQDPYEETAPLEWNGKTGHTVPAGDTHIVYPGEDGSVLSSMRLESQREGMEDWELLEMLKKKDLKKAHAIIKKVFRAFNDYNADPAEIRKARKSLLEALS